RGGLGRAVCRGAGHRGRQDREDDEGTGPDTLRSEVQQRHPVARQDDDEHRAVRDQGGAARTAVAGMTRTACRPTAVLALAITAVVTVTAEVHWQGTDQRVQERTRMIDQQIRGRGVRNERVLEAIARVPRHLFVPEAHRPEAYGDHPLPIGRGQTISQPYIVAYMTELLDPRPEHRVLEIGTGSGYQTAVLAELVREVYSIEIIDELAERARGVLTSLGYTHVRLRTGDGYGGWPEAAPFDGILVTA